MLTFTIKTNKNKECKVNKIDKLKTVLFTFSFLPVTAVSISHYNLI